MAIALTVWPLPSISDTLGYVVIYATQAYSAGVNRPPERAYRYMGKFNEDDIPPFSILTPWNKAFGPLRAGTKIFFRLEVITFTGIPSPKFYSSKIVS